MPTQPLEATTYNRSTEGREDDVGLAERVQRFKEMALGIAGDFRTKCENLFPPKQSITRVPFELPINGVETAEYFPNPRKAIIIPKGQSVYYAHMQRMNAANSELLGI